MLLAMLSIFTGCARPSRERVFWDWFQKNEAMLFHFEKDQERVFDLLTVQLRKVDPKLTFEFSSIENDRREFTISADGIRAAFPKVEALYAAAPTLPRWKINKFRQRHEPGDISFRGLIVKQSSVLILLSPNGSKADITLFMPEYSETNRDANLSIAFLLLDQALGEYDVETSVGGVAVKSASEAPPAAFPFRELPREFDSLFLRKN
ncbi:MAG TPA: hypothetical protein VGF61_21605 [Candidatus Acidoferrum sp.]